MRWLKLESIGKMIKDIRERRDMSRKELSIIIGISPSMLSKIEKEERNLTEERIDVMAKKMDLKKEEVLELKDSTARFLNKLPKDIVEKVLKNKELYNFIREYCPKNAGKVEDTGDHLANWQVW